MKNTSWRSPLLLFLTALIWGVAFVAQSVGMDYVGAFTFNCTRCLIGGIVLIPCIFLLDRIRDGGKSAEDNQSGMVPDGKNRDANKRGITPDGKSADAKRAGISGDASGRRTLVTGGICCGIALFVASNLQQFGIKYTSVGKAGFITALYIVIVPLFGIFLKKRVGVKIWFSVVLAVIGLYLLCIKEGFSIGFGDLLVLACAAVFAVHILVIDHFSPMVDGVRMSCIQFFVCGLLSGVGMLLFEEPQLKGILTAWMPILYAGVMSCGVAYTLQIVGQKDMDPTVASLILSLESVVSVLAGWVLLGQKLSARELSGCVLMFGAIILAQLPERRKR